MRPSPAPLRSRPRGARTQTGPRRVTILRSGRGPWRTSRWRPFSVCLSAWLARKAATSASTACASSARAPSRRTSVSGSEKAPGWINRTTVSWVMAYHSLAGEVEVSNTPTIRRLTPSRRHQLPRIPPDPAPAALCGRQMAPRRSVPDDRRPEALALAVGRPGWGCARRSRPEPAGQTGRQALAPQAAEKAVPDPACHDHRQARQLQRREGGGDAFGRASKAQRLEQPGRKLPSADAAPRAADEAVQVARLGPTLPLRP